MIAIRLAGESDAGQIQAIYAPAVRNTFISFELEPPPVAEMAQRIRKTLERFPWLVCERDGSVLGYAYASSYRARAAYQWSLEVTVYVHSDARRMGVGRGLYCSLLQVLALQGFYNAYAGIALPNPASVGLHEALGFTPVGIYRAAGYKLGGWHDVSWWQYALRTPASDPQPPLSLGDACGSAAWQAALSSGVSCLSVR